MAGLNDLLIDEKPQISQDVLSELFKRVSRSKAGDIRLTPKMSADNVQAPQHKGLFGVKGTFRDILGVLGDALMAAGGYRGDDTYSNTRHRERAQDALVAYDIDPEGAIRKLMGVDPEAGIKLQNSRNLDMYRQGVLQNQEDKIAAATQKQEDAQLMRSFGVLASIARSGNSKESWPGAAQLMRDTAERMGVELPFDIPDTYDPDFVQRVTAIGMKPADAIRLDQNEYRNRKYGEGVDSQIQSRKTRDSIYATSEANKNQNRDARTGISGANVASQIQSRQTRDGVYADSEANKNRNRDARTSISGANVASQITRRETQNDVQRNKSETPYPKPPMSSNGAPPGKGYSYRGKVWIPDGNGGWK